MLQSMGSQRVGHNLATEQWQQRVKLIPPSPHKMNISFFGDNIKDIFYNLSTLIYPDVAILDWNDYFTDWREHYWPSYLISFKFPLLH